MPAWRSAYAVLDDDFEQATVTYYLLLDSQRSHNPDDYLESDFEELVSSRFLVDRA